MKQSVWLIYSPSGRAMTLTVAMNRKGAKRKCLNYIERKYHGLVETNFKKWEAKGYKCKRATIIPEKEGE
jgi:hypothetical protein